MEERRTGKNSIASTQRTRTRKNPIPRSNESRSNDYGTYWFTTDWMAFAQIWYPCADGCR